MKTINRSCLALLLVAGCAAAAKPLVSPAPTPATFTLAALAIHRAEMIAALERYELAGDYPRDPATSLPVSEFRDDRGVRCPMAELIYQSGHGELVDSIVRTNNKLRLADVHGGPLYDWMIHSGLTAREIATVQGALEIRIDPEMSRAIAMASALGRVRGRLEATIEALRAATPYSLAEAAAKLPHPTQVATE